MTFQFQLTGNQRLVNWNTEGLMNSLDSLVVFWYIFILNCWILIRKGEWECKACLLSSTWKGYSFLFVCFILCCKYCCRNAVCLPSSYLVFGCQVVVSWEAAGKDLKQYYLFCKCGSQTKSESTFDHFKWNFIFKLWGELWRRERRVQVSFAPFFWVRLLCFPHWRLISKRFFFLLWDLCFSWPVILCIVIK